MIAEQRLVDDFRFGMLLGDLDQLTESVMEWAKKYASVPDLDVRLAPLAYDKLIALREELLERAPAAAARIVAEEAAAAEGEAA